MKIYVENLPKNCADCPCRTYHEYWDESYCNVKDNTIEYIYEKQKNCPLQSLSEYAKQVRNEVCEEIRNKLKQKEIFHPEDDFEIDYDFYYKEDVDEVLDQTQGENDDTRRNY